MGMCFVGPIENFNFANIPFILITVLLRCAYKFNFKNSN